MKKRMLLLTWLLACFASGPGFAQDTTPIPYEINFYMGDTEGWTGLDYATGNASTDWRYMENSWYEGGAYVPSVEMRGFGEGKNDLWISPAFRLEAGKAYAVQTLGAQEDNPSVSLWLGTNPADVNSFDQLAELELGNAFPQTAASTPVTVSTTGVYHIAYRSEVGNYQPGTVYLFAFGIDEDGGSTAPEAITAYPYENDFRKTTDGWTPVDNNGDNTTWTFYEDLGVTVYQTAGQSDDDFVSPAFVMKVGNDYVFDVIVEAMLSGSSSNDDITLRWSTDKIEWTEIGSVDIIGSGSNVSKLRFAPPADGEYYFSFYNRSPASYSMMYLTTLTVSEEENVVEPEPEPIVLYPYESNFKQGLNGWNPVDNNDDNTTWQLYDGAGVTVYQPTGRSDDDFVSPPFVMRAGKDYVFTATFESTNMTGMASNDVISLRWSTDKTQWTEVGTISITAFGPNVSELRFTPSADGEYYFSFYNQSPASYSPSYLASLTVTDAGTSGGGDEDEVVFEADFKADGATMDGWTTADVDNDKNTWQMIDGIEGVIYESGFVRDGDDWLFSPAIALEEGKDYIVEYTLMQSGAFDPAPYKLACGTAAEAAAMQTVVAEGELSLAGGEGMQTFRNRFTAPTTGNAFMGLYTANPVENGRFGLMDVKITRTAKAVACPVSDLRAVVDNQAQQVLFSWTNPTLDTAGVPVTTPLAARVYQDGGLCHTTEATLEAGEECTLRVTPNDFGGVSTFGVSLLIGETESETVNIDVNMADVLGDLVLLKAFEVDGDKFKTDWKTECPVGTSLWRWEYGEVMTYEHVWNSPGNDWLLTPGVALTPGVRYVLRYDLISLREYAPELTVAMGLEQNVAAQTTMLAEYRPLDINEWTTLETDQFSVDYNDDYYFGFRADNTQRFFSLRRVALYYVQQRPTAVDGAETAGAFFERAAAVLTLPEGCTRVAVYDMQGRLVAAPQAGVQADLSALAGGCYIVRYTTAGGATESLKIVR